MTTPTNVNPPIVAANYSIQKPTYNTVLKVLVVAALVLTCLTGVLGYTEVISMSAIAATALTFIPILIGACFLRYACRNLCC